MKTFKLNIHEGLSLTVLTECILETHNVSHLIRDSKKMYAYHVLSKKVDENTYSYPDLGRIKNKDLVFKTDEGDLVIHRFASLNLFDLENFVRNDLNNWFLEHQDKITRVERDKVEVKYLDRDCLRCDIYGFIMEPIRF
jgi:hypothetical protein